MFVHEFRREKLKRIIQKLRFVTLSHPLAFLLIIDMLKNIGHGGNRVRLLLYNNYLIKTQFVCELEC